MLNPIQGWRSLADNFWRTTSISDNTHHPTRVMRQQRWIFGLRSKSLGRV